MVFTNNPQTHVIQTNGDRLLATSASSVLKLLIRKKINIGYTHTLTFANNITNSAYLDKSPIWEHDISPKEIMDKILGDTMDRHSFLSLCPDCERRSRSCTACKRRNSPGSLHEMEELRQLQANVRLIPNPN